MGSYYTIQDMQEYAALKGGRCLSKEYVNSRAKLEWQCGKGHRWAADIGIIKQGGWCRACLRDLRNEEILQELQEAALLKGGKCLSTEYHGWKSNLTWRCASGHEWDAGMRMIKEGRWCRACLKEQRNKEILQELREVAFRKGGKCLSTEFHDWHSKLTWACDKGHEWEANALHVKNDHSWCPHCSRKAKLTIEQMREVAKAKGGKCLSPKYVNTYVKLLWQCEKGHTWEAAPTKILIGRWCPHYNCRYRKVSEKLRADIKELQELAKARKGKLLSTEYINRYTALTWQCDKGHIWKSKPVGIIHRKSWCPVCANKRRGRKRMHTA